MLDFPEKGEGLDWIVNQGTAHLILIPGVQAASITAAALGDEKAQAYLRFKALDFAAFPAPAGCTDRSSFTPFGRSTAAHQMASCADGHEDSDPLDSDEELQLESEFYRREAATAEIFERACRQLQLAAMKWLRALCHQAFDISSTLPMRAASASGGIEALKYLRSGPWDDSVVSAAVPHLHCLKWLLSQDPPCPCNAGSLLADMAASGSLDALKWLHVRSYGLGSWNPGHHLTFTWNEEVGLVAAEHGNLPLLQWLRSLDPPVPWGIALCTAPARHGHLALLQWARLQGCPWDKSCVSAAVIRGDLELLEWCRAQDPPCAWLDHSTSEAARSGQLGVLQWLCS